MWSITKKILKGFSRFVLRIFKNLRDTRSILRKTWIWRKESWWWRFKMIMEMMKEDKTLSTLEI